MDSGGRATSGETGLLDGATAQAFLKQWEPFARRLAYRFGRPSEKEDLEQVARVALWQAARRFDPARGCSFGTFANATIVGSLRRYVRDQALAHGVPRRWWDLRPRLTRAAEALAQAAGREPTVAELAEHLGADEEDVVGALGVHDLCHRLPLDDLTAGPEGGELRPLSERLAALDPELETAELRLVVRDAIARLPGPLREILRQRYYHNKTQQEVGRALGVSQMQISRLERDALGRLRQGLRDAMGRESAAPGEGPAPDDPPVVQADDTACAGSATAPPGGPEEREAPPAAADQPSADRRSIPVSPRNRLPRKAVVMAGGEGSRLQPLTLSRPKPLVPVANRPVLAHILEWLRRYGVAEVLLTLHYRADDIHRVLGDGRDWGLKLTYRIEDEPLGTAGSVKNAEDWIADEPFLVVSGDALTDGHLEALCRRHEEVGSLLTLGLRRVADPSAYGVVVLDDRGRVVLFQEKPEPDQAFSNLANTGIYCVAPEALDWVPRSQACDWSRDIFPKLIAAGKLLCGHVLDGYWCDVGTMEAYRRGQRDALTGAVRVALPAVERRPGVWVGAHARIAPDVQVTGPVLLGAGCRIEGEAQVLPGSVIGEQTIIRGGACIQGAILGMRCEIGPGAFVRNCVIDDEVRIGAGCTVSEGAVIGRGSRLERGFHLGAGQRVGPGEMLSGAPPHAPAEEAALALA